MSYSRRTALCLLAAGIVAGCAGRRGREVLAYRDSVAPDGVDFSGQWVLQDRADESSAPLSDAETGVAIDRESMRRSSKRRSSRGKTSLVYVFLESGRNLKVTQTTTGLFISFDRSIVEEYRFGEHRPVSVGPITADRSSGFEGSAYVIETLDDEGNRLIDRYELIDDGDVLLRQINVYKKEDVELSLVQTFERT